MVKICMLQAFEGDFIWLSYGDKSANMHILIDGGTKECGEKYAEIIKQIAARDEKIEAIILTHIDCDHIDGVCNGISRVKAEILQRTVKRILFNTYDDTAKSVCINLSSKGYGIGEAIEFLELLKKKEIYTCLKKYLISGDVIRLGGEAILRIISPGKKEIKRLKNKWQLYEDRRKSEPIGYSLNLEQIKTNLDDLMEVKVRQDSSVNNIASLAFLFEYDDIKGAFLGDAKPSVCIEGIKKSSLEVPYCIDFIKLSHHGSMRNINGDLLKWLQTENYMLSTNGNNGKTPAKPAVAQLLLSNTKKERKKIFLYCNYEWWDNIYYGRYFTEEDKKKYINTKMLELHMLNKNEIAVKDGLIFYGEE